MKGRKKRVATLEALAADAAEYRRLEAQLTDIGVRLAVDSITLLEAGEDATKVKRILPLGYASFKVANYLIDKQEAEEKERRRAGRKKSRKAKA